MSAPNQSDDPRVPQAAASDDERRTAYVGLSYCTGSIVCPRLSSSMMICVRI